MKISLTSFVFLHVLAKSNNNSTVNIQRRLI